MRKKSMINPMKKLLVLIFMGIALYSCSKTYIGEKEYSYGILVEKM